MLTEFEYLVQNCHCHLKYNAVVFIAYNFVKNILKKSMLTYIFVTFC
jgi:hypothetical protein